MSKALGKRFRRIIRGEDPVFDHWLAYLDAPADGAGGRQGDPGQGKG